MLAAMSPTTIRAAVLERPGVEPRIEELTLDGPRDGEVLVRMAASGVCHSTSTSATASGTGAARS